MKFGLHSLIVIVLTIVSQLGGIAWLVALCFRRRLFVFVMAYALLAVGATWVAPMFGRVPLSCFSGDVLKVQSPVYCVLNRQYVVPELKQVLVDYAADMDQAFDGTQTRVLDANFPFVAGFPLLPHLSHHDGRKVDLAFYYADDTGYLPGIAKSPLGYFAFEPGPTDCPEQVVSLRWDLEWVQQFWPVMQLEPSRMTSALMWLGDDPRVGKVFIEPHLKEALNAQSDKIRFQGCRAARHDDHIHIQL